VALEPSPSQLTNDAGLLPLREFDQQVQFTPAFADARDAPRALDLAAARWACYSRPDRWRRSGRTGSCGREVDQTGERNAESRIALGVKL